MRLLPILATALCLGATGAAAREDDAPSRSEVQIAKALEGRVAGEPRNCLSPQESRMSHNYDGAVLFRKNSRVTYLNEMNGCPLLRDGDILKTRLYGSARLCRGDIAVIIDGAGRYEKGACSYGDFVPYEKPG